MTQALVTSITPRTTAVGPNVEFRTSRAAANSASCAAPRAARRVRIWLRRMLRPWRSAPGNIATGFLRRVKGPRLGQACHGHADDQYPPCAANSKPFANLVPPPMRTQDFSPLPERITFTVDVEQHAGADCNKPRYVAMTGRILDFLAERHAVGTFFIVGEVAERTPELVREIARQGHEIASHSHRHPRCPSAETTASAASSLQAGVVGGPSSGPSSAFAPRSFPLCPLLPGRSMRWSSAGFAYSSSIVPGNGIGCGWPGAPSDPFMWANGLLELPCPVGRVAFFQAAVPGRNVSALFAALAPAPSIAFPVHRRHMDLLPPL